MKRTLVLFSSCLILIPVLAVAGSDGIKQAEPPAANSSQSDVMSYVRTALTPAKEFLGSETQHLKSWMREILATPSGRSTPKVVVDLPPLVPREPAAEVIMPEQPVEMPTVLEEPLKVEPEHILQVETPEPEEVSAQQADSLEPVADPVIIEQEVAKQEAVPKIKVFQPGKPKPAPPVGVVEITKVENSIRHAQPLPRPVSVVETTMVKEDNSAPAVVTGLALGLSMKLGSPFDGDDKSCINKQNGYVLFCAQEIIWPEHIRQFFDSGVNLYQGTQAVVRYDGKILTHAHALFFTSRLKEVVNYFETRFGAPLDTFQRIVTPFGGRPKNNPTLIWRKNENVNGEMKAITLEVRGIDDSRGGFPDMKHGLVRLYGSDSLPIFPRVSTTEMMLMKHALN